MAPAVFKTVDCNFIAVAGSIPALPHSYGENARREYFKSIPRLNRFSRMNKFPYLYPPSAEASTVIDIIREEVALVREKLKSGQPQDANFLTTAILRRCAAKKLEKLQRVINGTGVIIHTNLGRAPLSAEVLDELRQSLCGYCNLELHLPTHARGRRGGFAEELFAASPWRRTRLS